ncbi:hypothetical protein Fmac_030916 [Flemingia macrophylla]|uniref:Uncharacterized protein n=1 Tax=Flemingia macrophylla TaxID=520843 RepID=A0ABD1L0J2_9FABA
MIMDPIMFGGSNPSSNLIIFVNKFVDMFSPCHVSRLASQLPHVSKDTGSCPLSLRTQQ